MLSNFISSKEYTLKIIGKVLSLMLFCFITVLLFFLIAAFVITKTDFSYEMLATITTILLSAAAFLDSFVVSRFIKENGLVIGAIIGTIIFVFVLIASLSLGQFRLSSMLFTKLAAIVISGVIGGIIGVNTN